MAQVAADGLRIPVSLVRVTATDTQKVPNASATAASSGADINGAAINDATRQLRERLDALDAGRNLPWKDLVKQAWLNRIQLGQTGYYMTPDIQYDFMTLQGKAFYYFCYGAAVTETEIDTRTGEWWLKAVDIVHDVGQSINPAIDKGQIEGAYVQGMGWLTMEECIWDMKAAKDKMGKGYGKLLTHGPSTYKIPVASDIPEHFNVTFFDTQNIKLRDAVVAAGGNQNLVSMDAPATPERILMACEAAKK
jgi:xanthine dehydrogenase large subunit